MKINSKNAYTVTTMDFKGKTIVKYDSHNNKIYKKTPNGVETNWVYKYDEDGNVIECICERNNKIISISTFEYKKESVLDKYRRKTGPGCHYVNGVFYKYNDRGNMVCVIMPGNHTYEYTYDDDDNLICVICPNGDEYHYTYDENGELLDKKRINAKKNVNNR